MNNEIRNRDGKVIGFECFKCGGMFQRMWGTVCNECRDIRRTTTGASQMSEWQPIETAPKDVMFIAYYIGYRRPFIAWWNVADQCFESDSSIIMDDGPESPTHWMPLPEVPKELL